MLPLFDIHIAKKFVSTYIYTVHVHVHVGNINVQSTYSLKMVHVAVYIATETFEFSQKFLASVIFITATMHVTMYIHIHVCTPLPYTVQDTSKRVPFIRNKMAQILALTFITDYPLKVGNMPQCAHMYMNRHANAHMFVYMCTCSLCYINTSTPKP